VRTVFGDAELEFITPPSTYTLVPGLDMTLNIPPNSKVVVSTDGGAVSTVPAPGSTTVDVALFVDGGMLPSGGFRRIVPANITGVGGVVGNWSFSVSLSLTPGLHTFQVKAYASAASRLSGISTPSSSSRPRQGQLTVMILKQ
jgi:hypothetical protein